MQIAGTPQPATLGQAYSFIPTVTCGSGSLTFAFAGSTSPADLGGTFSTTTGAIFGPFSVQGVVAGTITATDASGSAQLVVSFSATDSAANSAYAFTRSTSALINKPPLMVAPTPDDGPYYPWLVEMSGVADFPYWYATYFSTDHSDSNNNNGIYLYVAAPKSAAKPNARAAFAAMTWLSYDDARPSFTGASYASAPAANPILHRHDLADAQTPCVNIVAGQVVMSVQQQGTSAERGGALGQQSTMRTVSGNGVNFPTPSLWVDIAPNQGVGDGHCGYLQWGPNLFAGPINPATGAKWAYIGYSLAGGNARGLDAQWGTGDPIAGQWALITQLQTVAGRVSDALGNSYFVQWNACDPRTVKQVPQGYSMLIAANTPGFGDQKRYAKMLEVVLDANGQKVLAKPNVVLERGATGGFDSGEVTTPSALTLSDGYVMLYAAPTPATRTRSAWRPARFARCLPWRSRRCSPPSRRPPPLRLHRAGRQAHAARSRDGRHRGSRACLRL